MPESSARTTLGLPLFWSAALDALTGHVAVLDRNGSILTTNVAWNRFADENGYADACYPYGIGANYLEICEKAARSGCDDASQMLHQLTEVLAGRTSGFALEYACASPWEERWFRVNVLPIRAADSGGAVVVHENITTRVTAEQRRVAEQNRFQALIENSADHIFVFSAAGALLYVSPRAPALLGYESAAQFPTEFLHLIHPDDRVVAQSAFTQIVQTTAATTSFEVRLRHQWGHWVWIEAILTNRIADPGVEGVVINVRDITARMRAEVALAEVEQRYRELFDSATDVVYYVNLDGKLVWLNAAAEAAFGCAAEAAVGTSIAAFTSQPRIADLLAAGGTGESAGLCNAHIVAASGQRLAVETRSTVFCRDGVPVGILTIGRDITERERREAFERGRRLVLESVAQNKPLLFVLQEVALLVQQQYPGSACVIRLAADDALSIAASTEHLPLEYANAFWSVATDNPLHPSAEVMRSAAPVVVPDLSIRTDEWSRIVGRAGFRSNCTYPLLSGNGRLWGTMEVYRPYGGSAEFHSTTLIETAHLATLTVEHTRFTEQLAYQARHDALTGLPNRLAFEQQLEETVTLAREHSQSLAVLFLDLDDFKQINDRFGHLTGDELLRQVANRLRHIVRAPDTLARVGGDEFTVITQRLQTHDDEQMIATAVLRCFHQPFAIHGHEVQASASVGVSVFPRDATSLPQLVRRADTAMYEAKFAGKNSWRSSASGGTAAESTPASLRADLELALGRNELNLVYQPQISLDTGELCGFEALLRWRHPVLGSVSPKFFIPMAEESGLIVRLGKWVAEQACLQLSEWRKAGLSTRAAINVSAVQFRRGAWPDEVREILLRTGLPPNCLELELTETAMMKDVDQAIACMNRLRKMGVALSIDDFGAGYSSLAYLKRFRVDRLKLDSAFVSGIKGGSTQALLVGAVTGLAHSLGIKVVAEGVENRGQLALLRQLNCDEAQGFYIGRPMSADDATARLREKSLPGSGTDRKAGSRLPEKPARSR